MHVIAKWIFIWPGFMVCQGLCQTNQPGGTSTDSQDYTLSYVLPVGEPANFYLNFFGGVNEIGKREISLHARTAIGLDEQEVRALLTITSDLAMKSHEFGKRVKPLMFESRMQAIESDNVSPALRNKIDSLAAEWERVILEHVGQLKSALPEPVYRQLDEFVRTGGSLYVPVSAAANTPRVKF